MANKVIYCDTADLKKDVKDLTSALTGRQMHAALANALNRTLTFVGAETKRQVRSAYTVKSSSVAKALTKKKATRSMLIAEANYKDRPLPLYVFKHRIPNNQNRTPVSVTIKKGQGKQVEFSGGQVLFGAYGKTKIMRRDLTEKKIQTAYTVSVPQMVENEKVYDEIVKKAEAKLQERVDHEIQVRLDGIV